MSDQRGCAREANRRYYERTRGERRSSYQRVCKRCGGDFYSERALVWCRDCRDVYPAEYKEARAA
ncbi:Hypotetical protein [Gulosibacter molinativorax]|nr:Hypotetical protein [Gulosibacter molinativorax]